MITSHKFGSIEIDGAVYKSDVIIHPDRVEANWWRKEGHSLQVEDIAAAIEQDRPQVLIVGTGEFGVMKIPPRTAEYLQKQGVKLIAEKTDDACRIFNDLISKQKVVGAFHLTC